MHSIAAEAPVTPQVALDDRSSYLIGETYRPRRTLPRLAPQPVRLRDILTSVPRQGQGRHVRGTR